MNSQLVPGVLIPDADEALSIALDECRIASGKGTSFTFAFKNSEGEIYRMVEAAGYMEAARLANAAERLGFAVERAFDPDSPDGIHGIYCQSDVPTHDVGPVRGIGDGTDSSRRSRA